MFFLNLGFVVVLVLTAPVYFLVSVFPYITIEIKFIITLIIMIVIFNLYNGAVHGMVRDIADYKNPGFKDFFKHFKESYRVSLLFSLVFSIIIIVSFTSFYLYNYIDNILRYTAQTLIIGMVIIFLIACQYFYPIYFGLDKRFSKIIKKMFLIFFDNPLFSLGLILVNTISFIISFFSLLMVPGPSSMSLLLSVGLKLRLYKYDYIEENPGVKTKKIPWETLLVEDKEKIGKRTLKGMFFPWKE